MPIVHQMWQLHTHRCINLKKCLLAAPETINGRLAMIGVTSALAAEFTTGIGIKEQVATAPLSIAATFLLISFASYIPIVR